MKLILNPVLKMLILFFILIIFILALISFSWGWTINSVCGKGFLQCYGIPLGNRQCLGNTQWKGNIDCLPKK